MSHRILVIEDERKTAGFVRRGLVENDFEVEINADGETGFRRAIQDEFDLIILDVMLPNRDGWSILTDLRNAGRQTPVLFLTARDNVRDRVKGLSLGADDYLIKPFAFSELLARVQSVLRRSATKHPEVMHIADLEIDLIHRRAVRNRDRLELTPKEFELLSLLARHQGKSISRNMIAREVWDMEYDGGTNFVDVHIRRLRAKIDDPYDRKLLQTVRGVGYVLDDRG
jgi:two-component system copper resistance phosphate regulon response regulator CusR